MGRIRKEELYESCKILGIPESNVVIINSTVLPDDPEIVWKQDVVANIVANFLETYSIDTVSRKRPNKTKKLKKTIQFYFIFS